MCVASESRCYAKYLIDTNNQVFNMNSYCYLSCNVSFFQNTEEDSYYYEYPYYEDNEGKPLESTSDAETTKEVKVGYHHIIANIDFMC